MQVENMSTARTNLYTLAKTVVESHDPITITGKHGDVVLLSAKDYDALQETLCVMQTMPGIVKEASVANKAPKSAFVTEDKLPW